MGRKRKVLKGDPLHVVSFSGGKDSTAMLLMMIEKGMHIDEIVFCDTGMEHPEAIEHIKQVSKDIGREIKTLRDEHDYDYYCTKVKCADGTLGYGHPTLRSRWCTGHLKISVTEGYFDAKNRPLVVYLGIAADEAHRTEHNQSSKGERRFPLVEWGVTEKEALEYCYARGYDWGGLYKGLTRVSCWCCPFMSLKDIRFIYNERPQIWEKIKDLDSRTKNDFKETYSIEELEKISSGDFFKPMQACRFLKVTDTRFRAYIDFFNIEPKKIGKTNIKWYHIDDLEKIKTGLKEILDFSEAREYLNKTEYAINYAVKKGQLEKKYHPGVGLYFLKKDLDAYREKRASELTSKEACEFVGLEWDYFKELIHRKRVKFYKRKQERLYFKEDDLVQFKYEMENRLNTKQACEFLQISYKMVKDLLKEGKLKRYKEKGRHPYFLIDELKKFKEELNNDTKRSNSSS